MIHVMHATNTMRRERKKTMRVHNRRTPFLNEVRKAIRVRRLSLSTERSYLHYIIGYFHDKRHPEDGTDWTMPGIPSMLPLCLSI